MVVFQEAALGAATVRTDERTLSTITRPDLALDLRWNVARGSIRVARWSWPSSRGMASLAEIRHQKRQRSIEDRRRIAIGNNMAQQIWASRRRACISQDIVNWSL